jgi:sugar (pentulose or hexulose) kinase
MYLGIDVGTSSLKTVLANEKGEIIDQSSASYELLIPKQG